MRFDSSASRDVSTRSPSTATPGGTHSVEPVASSTWEASTSRSLAPVTATLVGDARRPRPATSSIACFLSSDCTPLQSRSAVLRLWSIALP